MLDVVPDRAAPIEGAEMPVGVMPPTFVCPHCGAAMRIIDTFTRGMPIRAPPKPPAAP